MNYLNHKKNEVRKLRFFIQFLVILLTINDVPLSFEVLFQTL